MFMRPSLRRSLFTACRGGASCPPRKNALHEPARLKYGFGMNFERELTKGKAGR
jgi:hypothetical protein